MEIQKNKIDWLQLGIFFFASAVGFLVFRYICRDEILYKFVSNYLIFPKYPDLVKRLVSNSVLPERVLDYSPLYTSVMYYLYGLFTDNYLFYICFQVLIGALNCLLIYNICSYLFNPRVALLAGLIAVLYRPFIIYTFVLEPAIIIICLNLLTVYMLLYAQERGNISSQDSATRPIYPADAKCAGQDTISQDSTVRSTKKNSGAMPVLIWLIPGITMGLSFITRPNILIFSLFAVIWIALLLKGKKARGYVLISNIMLVILGFLIAVCPILMKNYYISGKLLKPLMSSGQVFYQGNNPMARGFYGSHPYLLKEMEVDPRINTDGETDFAHELYRLFVPNEYRDGSKTSNRPEAFGHRSPDPDQFWFNRSMNYIRLFPNKYLSLLSAKLRYFFSRYEIHDILNVYYLDWSIGGLPLLGLGTIVPLALLGMILLLKEIKRYLLLYAMVVNYLISNLIFFVSARQRLLVLPFLIPFAAFAIYYLLDKIKIILQGINPLTAPYMKSYPVRIVVLKTFVLLMLLAMLFKFVNLPSTQIEEFELMLRANRDSRIKLASAYNALKRDDIQDAKEIFQLAYNLMPLHQTRIPNRFLGEKGKGISNAITFWEETLERKGDNTYARFILAWLLLQNRDYKRAKMAFQTLVDENVEGFYGYLQPISQPGYFLAKSLEKMGDHGHAIEVLEYINEKTPGLPWVGTHLVALYEATGQEHKAIRLRDLLKDLDNPISCTYLQAEAYYDTNHYKRAIKELIAIQSTIIDHYSPYYFLLSACYSQLARGIPVSDQVAQKAAIDLAIMACRRGLGLGTHLNLIYPETIWAYQATLSDSPDDPALYYEMGIIYYNLGMLHEARESLKKAISLMDEKQPPPMKASIREMLDEIGLLTQDRVKDRYRFDIGA